jgi:hypothetical protein
VKLPLESRSRIGLEQVVLLGVNVRARPARWSEITGVASRDLFSTALVNA